MTTSWIDSPPDVYQSYEVPDGFYYIHKGAKISGGVNIGKFSYINSGTVLGGKFPIEIGAFCSFSVGVYCWTYESHDIEHVTSSPLRTVLGVDLKYSECVEKPEGVSIGNDVYLGAGVRIMPGVRIGNGVVVGARSVVARDLEPYGVYVGAPARLVKKRFPDHVIQALQEIEWWKWPTEKIKLNADFFNLKLSGSSYREIFDSLKSGPEIEIDDPAFMNSNQMA